jgi:hypothetical protein
MTEDVLTSFIGTAAERGLFTSNRFPSQSRVRSLIYSAIPEQEERNLPFSSH